MPHRSARSFSALLSLALVSLVAPRAHADTIIDPFDQGTINSLAGPFSGNSQSGLDVLGDDRTSTVSINGILDIDNLVAEALRFSSGAGMNTVSLLLSYDVAVPVNLEGSNPGFFQIDIVDASDPVQIFIAVTDADSTEKKAVLAIPASGVATLDYAAFSQTNFQNVLAVGLEILLPQVNSTITIAQFTAVPEPSAVILLGLGLLGLGLVGRSRRGTAV